VDVGGHCTLSGQQIWTLMDVPGRSGNTLKVPGSMWKVVDHAGENKLGHVLAGLPG
jgi:hypothetical protein